MTSIGNKEIFSANLNYYMEKREKSRNEICEALGFKYTTFTDWCNGVKYPRIDNIEKLSAYFGINKSDLIESKDHSDEIEEYLEQLRTRSEMRMLFSVGKDATKEDIEKVVEMFKIMKGE